MNFPNPYLGYNSPGYVPQPVMQQYQASNMMPTIRTEIIQVDSEDFVNQYTIGNGQSQMFITKDETKIYVKSGTQNGSEIIEYQKSPPKKAPEYVTVEQLQAMLKELGLGKGAEE